MAKSRIKSAELRDDLMDLVPLERRRELRAQIQEWVLGKGAILDVLLDELEVAFALREFKIALGNAIDTAKLDGLARKYEVTGLTAVDGVALEIGVKRVRERRGVNRISTLKFESITGFARRAGGLIED